MAFELYDQADAPQGPNKALGRPTKYDEKTVTKVLYALQKGSTFKLAAAYAGISYDALMHWKAESAKHGEASMYYPFHLMVEENVAKGAVRALEMVDTAALVDWRAAAWRLAHAPSTRHDYADKVEVTGADGEPLIPLAALRDLVAQAQSQGTDDDDFAAENVTPIRSNQSA